MLIQIRKIVSRSVFTPAFITWLVCSFISQTALAGQILVDKSVAGVKPMVLTAPNGVPLVNIATADANGVSKNQYTQFDVNSEGVILNNSLNPVNTTLGGYVPGNSQLGDYSARIILNQVNGSSVSSLNGYLEVAGQNAQVIVANENGITCNGCGFINTSAGTLTTGQVHTGVGGVSNYQVQQGLLQINGTGLNASNTPELTLMGRHIKVDAPIHAQALNLVAGVNEVAANNSATQINSHIPASSNTAIDTGALGGMYANRIHLVSTEAGLGVNVAGTVLAQAGTLTLDSQGKLTVSALVQADTQLSASANEGFTLLSSGQLEAKESVAINTQETAEIAGSITGLTTVNMNGQSIKVSTTGDISAQGKLSVDADELVTLEGALASQSDIAVSAADVGASGKIAAKSDLSVVVGESIDATSGHQLMAGGNLRLSANTVVLGNGRVEASEQAHVQANTSTILNQQVLLGQQVTLENHTAGKIDTTTLNNAYIGATQGLTLQTKALVINQGQKQSSTGNNVYSVVSDGDTQLVVDSLHDNGSQIYSHGALDITAEQTISSSGTWVAGNAADNASNITLTSGGNTQLSEATLDASGNVTFNTQGLSATQSRLQAKNTLALNVQGTSATQAADLSQSTLVANDISLTADHLNADATQASAVNNIDLGTTRVQNLGQWV
ncbi:MAG: filamentous hemagglutinin N-terminal domain-containing protein, partial [Oceanospirillaceae bacterium]|nr:filamentous hemagglutinin N-terminal domain-containing protein [Oceanospirillaceae bacterium]